MCIKNVAKVSGLEDAALHARMVRARHQRFELRFFCGGGTSGKLRAVRRTRRLGERQWLDGAVCNRSLSPGTLDTQASVQDSLTVGI
jgi:hypothetical protein